MSRMNRKHNSGNMAQGDHRKVLCVCSAGLLRSPTAAVVLSHPPFNFNTRAAGIVPDFALVPVDDVLLHWADEIVCMTVEHKEQLEFILEQEGMKKKVKCLDIPDNFRYRDPALMELIAQKYTEASK